MKPEFMLKAIEIAKTSGVDIPVGAVIVKSGEIIAKGVNGREKDNLAISHAEINAIIEANKKIGNWRLNGCEMYVTLEPCPMCASAILQSRISKVYFGSFDLINGAFGSKCDMRKIMGIDVEVKGGIIETECSDLLKQYFERIRK